MQLRPLNSVLASLREENDQLKHELSHIKKENLHMQMLMVPNYQPGASGSGLSSKVEESSKNVLKFEIMLRDLNVKVDLKI